MIGIPGWMTCAAASIAKISAVLNRTTAGTVIGAVAPAPVPEGAAREFLDVQMLDASQSDRAFQAADLQLQLRLVNRAEWPIDYAFSVSGGHYLNCVPRAEFYRHDRYGYIEGRLQPGQSLQRAIEVSGVQHNPHPWFGPQKCAGFKDLEGFENFSGKGYKVTKVLRWSM